MSDRREPERLPKWGPFPGKRGPTTATINRKAREETRAANPFFATMINMAIHVAMEDMRWRGESYRLAFCHDAADVIASTGDVAEARKGAKGETAKAFALIARAVASLAYQPGGVTFLGTHYEVKE